MKLILFLSLLAILPFSGCSSPKAEKGNFMISFRDAKTQQPIEEGAIEVSVIAGGPMYSGKQLEQWSSTGAMIKKGGTFDLFDVQLASYVLEIDAKGYDTQKSIFDIENGSMKDWSMMRIDRSYPFEPNKRIEYLVTIRNK